MTACLNSILRIIKSDQVNGNFAMTKESSWRPSGKALKPRTVLRQGDRGSSMRRLPGLRGAVEVLERTGSASLDFTL
jgi:hypothetical protein